MTKDIKELVEMAKGIEKETLESGQDVMMKIIGVDSEGKTYIFVLAGYDPDIKEKILPGLGAKMTEMIPELENLIMVSDTYAMVAKTDELKSEEKEVIDSVMAGKFRLSEIPEEYKHLRKDALVVLVTEKTHETISFNIIPYTRVGGVVTFEEGELSEGKADNFTDNMLRYVWEGYDRAKTIVI